MAVGDVTFVDSRQPFSLEFREDFAYTSTLVERSALESILSYANAAHGSVIQPPTGAALGAFMISLRQQQTGEERDDTVPVNDTRVRDHLLGLIATALEPVASRRVAPPPSDKVVLRNRIKAWLVSQLSRDDLSAEETAMVFGISTRQLRRLFREEGNTFSRWGIVDPAYFSRRFKARYGATPSDYRQRSIMSSPCNDS